LRRICPGLFLLTTLYASTWENPYPTNSLTDAAAFQGDNSRDDRLHLKIYSSGLLNLSTFAAADTSLPGPLPSFLAYPELAIKAAFKTGGLQISGQKIISAYGYRLESDSTQPANFINIYRFNGEARWHPLSWLGVSAGYIHFLGQLTKNQSVMLDQASSFSIGALFEPLKNLKLNLLTQAPARLYFKGPAGSPADTLRLPLIVSTDIILSASEKFDVLATVRYSQVFTGKQDADSAGDFLKPFGFEIGAAYTPAPSLKLKLLGDYSASPLYPLQPPWADEQGLLIAVEGSWRKGPWTFSALLASGRNFSLDKSSGFNSNSYILRLGASFEL
jgi:hypothetical protein